MNKDLEKKITDAAIAYAKQHGIDFKLNRESLAWIKGAKSSESKEYWQQGMYTEEEVIKIVEEFNSYADKKLASDENPNLRGWFKRNKKNNYE